MNSALRHAQSVCTVPPMAESLNLISCSGTPSTPAGQGHSVQYCHDRTEGGRDAPSYEASQAISQRDAARRSAGRACSEVSNNSLYIPCMYVYSWSSRLFQSLAADTSPAVPYSRELADQRRKYGESLLRRCDEQITLQKQHESESQAKMEEARRKRQEERDKLEAIEVRW